MTAENDPAALPMPIRPRLLGGSLAVAAFALLAGSLLAALATLVSRIVWRAGPVTIPWGLMLALAAAVSVVMLSRALRRPAGFAAAGGWLIGLVVVLSPRSEGDYVVATDALGYAYLLLSALAVIVTATWGSAP